MSTSRQVRSLIVAVGLCVLAGAGPGGLMRGQQAAPPQAPAAQAPGPQPAAPPAEVTFRTDANFVLTDVFVTADGKPVTDLTQADFEVREDGVVQTVRSFEAVRHDAQPAVVARRDPSTVAESEAMIADPRRRVFVIFLDTFHVERSGSMVVREALMGFLKTALGPDDLVGFMTPHMSGRDISFTSSTSPLVRYLDDNPVWGVADEMPGTETDPIEKDLSSCFVGNDAAWGPLRSRLREQKTLASLRGLVAHLDGLRESRKAVITVTQGWRLFRENETRLTDAGNQNQIRGLDPVAGGRGGGLGTDDRGRLGGVAKGTCDGARLEAGFTDSQRLFQDLIGEANRASTSFYTLDAAGLRTETRPHPTNPLEAAVEARNRERMPYSTRLDSIRTLGESTNGMALVDSNDFSGSLRRAAADFNAYYLLGYTSTNGRSDGKYRKIKVAVKRPGVHVRAREGYLARRLNETAPSSTTSNGATAPSSSAMAEVARITAALGKLATARPGVPLVVSAAAGVMGAGSRAIRVTTELDSAIAATPEWVDGGEAQAFVRDAKGDTVTTAKAALPKGSRTVEIELPIVPGMAGDVKVQVRLTGTGPLARYTDTTSVALDAMPDGWGAPRLSRRGPSTGVAWVPTADPRFRRQERIRVSVGVGPEAGTITGTLLDRQGKPINVPVKMDQSEPAALVAELALAPLAVGDYVLALGSGPKRLLVPLRIVP
ncbi:MAG: VWA domain-containing protein [Vicinamibacteraceae bacterium]